MAQHKLVDGTLKGTDRGIEARCVCGWSSGHRFSSFIASAAFMDHQEEAENAVRWAAKEEPHG